MRPIQFRSLKGIACLCVLLLCLSTCSKKDPGPGTTGSSASGTINGQAVKFTTTTATDTGAGLEIVLADNTRKITIVLSDRKASTYPIRNTSTGRVAATPLASITVVSNEVAYYGTGGSVVLTVDGNGNVSGTANNIVLKSSASESLTIADVRIGNLEVGSVPDGCVISSFTYTVTDPNNKCALDDSYSFSYNADGKISQAMSPNGNLLFTYDVTGKLIAITGYSVNPSGTTLTHTEFSYSGTLLASYRKKTVHSDSIQYTFWIDSTDSLSYTGGTLTGVTIAYLASSGGTESNTREISFVNGNISHKTTSYSGDYQDFASYDSNKNPFALLARLIGIPISFPYGEIDDSLELFCLDTNNPLTRDRYEGTDTFEYTYGSNGYPTKIVYTLAPGQDYCGGVTITIAYSGC